MKAISIWEPWASLIACGAKHWETRSWPTYYRGPLLICASKGGLPKRELDELLLDWRFQAGLAPLVGMPIGGIPVSTAGKHCSAITHKHLQYGMAVAICRLTDCKPTAKITPDEISTDKPFGDFQSGRFAWKLEDIERLPKPIPVRGKQGLFSVSNIIQECTNMEVAG